jgi:hypothetical protein
MTSSWESEKLGEVVAEATVATTGVETIVNLVKSDAAGTCGQTDGKCRLLRRGRTRHSPLI